VRARIIRVGLLLVLTAATVASARQRDQPQPRIEGLKARHEQETFVVSYRLVNLLPEEVLDRIHSGIQQRFRHRIEIVEKRAGLFVADRVYARAILELGVTYDSLTQRYELARSIEIRGLPRAATPEPITERAEVDSEQAMRSWLGEVRDISIAQSQPVPEDARLTLRVEVVLGRRWLLLVIPTSETITAERALGTDG